MKIYSQPNSDSFYGCNVRDEQQNARHHVRFGRERDLFQTKTGIPEGSMQGMHRRSRQHGSPATQEVGERSSNKITVRAAMQKTPGLVRSERRHIVVEERSGPRSSCVITFLGRASMRTKRTVPVSGVNIFESVPDFRGRVSHVYSELIGLHEFSELYSQSRSRKSPTPCSTFVGDKLFDRRDGFNGSSKFFVSISPERFPLVISSKKKGNRNFRTV